MLAARALLTAVSVVVATLPAIVAIGAFAPEIPTIGRFGALLAEDLPLIWLGSIAAVALATIAVLMRGGRPARLTLVATMVVAGSLLVILAGSWSFAARHGAAYSPARQLQQPGPPPTADRQVSVATLGDGTTLRANVWEPVRPAVPDATASPSPGTSPDPGATQEPGAAGPALVYVHGGGFIGGGLDSRPHLFRFLATRGITVIDVEYRLAPPPRWQDAPADVLCALAWLGAHLADLRVDPRRVVIAGESAGGSLALLAGYAAGTDKLRPSCPGEPVVPAGVVAISPAADLAGIWADGTLMHEGRPFPETYVGGSPAEHPDRYDLASPFRLLRAGLPPTLIITGANDHLVLLARVTSLHARILGSGSEARLVVVPFADHGFDGYPNGYGAQLEESVLPAFIFEVTG